MHVPVHFMPCQGIDSDTVPRNLSAFLWGVEFPKKRLESGAIVLTQGEKYYLQKSEVVSSVHGQPGLQSRHLVLTLKCFTASQLFWLCALIWTNLIGSLCWMHIVSPRMCACSIQRFVLYCSLVSVLLLACVFTELWYKQMIVLNVIVFQLLCGIFGRKFFQLLTGFPVSRLVFTDRRLFEGQKLHKPKMLQKRRWKNAWMATFFCEAKKRTIGEPFPTEEIEEAEDAKTAEVSHFKARSSMRMLVCFL